MRKDALMSNKIIGDRLIVVFICLAGVLGVSYGMIRQNNVVFLLGLTLVIIGYLIIRRKLKSHVTSKYSRQ